MAAVVSAACPVAPIAAVAPGAAEVTGVAAGAAPGSVYLCVYVTRVANETIEKDIWVTS